MADDTISTDPKMREEARRAAAESAMPKVTFNPSAIAREEFERIVDKRYCPDDFEKVWSTMTDDVAKAPAPQADAMYGLLTEAEYRQLVAAVFHSCNSFFLMNAATEAKERGSVLHKAAMYTVNDRLKIEEKKVSTQIDLLHALLRSPVKGPSSGMKVCLIHPNGCPEDDSDPAGASIGRMILGALLGRK